MKLKLLSFLSFFSLLSFTWAGDVNPYHLAKDTNWYYHYNFEAAHQSELAIEFKDEIDELFSRIKEFDLIGLNPSEDLSSFTLYGNPQKQAVAILEGQFNASLLLTLKDLKAKKEFVNGYQVYQNKKLFATIHEDKFIVVAKNKEDLSKALNVINGLEPHLEIENNLLQSNAIASAAITDIDLAKHKLEKFGKSFMMSLPIKKISYSLKDNGTSYTTSFNVLSDSEVTKSLALLASGYLGLSETYLKNLPKFKAFVKAIQVSPEDDLLTVSSTVQNQDLRPLLIHFLEKAKNYQQKKSTK